MADARRLRVSGLGVAQAHMAPRGPRKVFGLAAAILLFGLGCTVMLGGARLRQAFRAAGARRPDRARVEPPDPAPVLHRRLLGRRRRRPFGRRDEAARTAYTRKRLLRGGRAS